MTRVSPTSLNSKEAIDLPIFTSTSATSSLFTDPSLSLSRTWNASRISLNCVGVNLAAASLEAAIMLAVFASMMEEESSAASAPLVGEDGNSLVNLGCGIGSLLFGEGPSSSATVYV